MALFGFLFGNWGLFDHVCGLEWVKENIESYGGDPNNVTIFDNLWTIRRTISVGIVGFGVTNIASYL